MKTTFAHLHNFDTVIDRHLGRVTATYVAECPDHADHLHMGVAGADFVCAHITYEVTLVDRIVYNFPTT